MREVIIVGGGAAGIAAALSASKAGVRVTILERLDRVGKKILATGNGKCNLSNMDITPEHYHTADPERLAVMLEKMPLEMILQFFSDLGLLTSPDEAGRIYPACRQANIVLDVLRISLERAKVRVITGCGVSSVAMEERFCLTCEDGRKFYADSVILTVGGRAAPKQGSIGMGYDMAAAFGHSCTRLHPALAGIQCEDSAFKSLKGIRANAGLTLYQEDAVLGREEGELQFNDYGLSGIPTMQLSCRLPDRMRGVSLSVDLFPEFTEEELLRELRRRFADHPDESAEDAMLGLLHRRLQYAVLKRAGIDAERRASSLSQKEIRALRDCLKDWRFSVKGTLSWDQAQVTLGGIPLRELTPDFESKLCPGLYLAGEILDAAGDCGGYNLHWAWGSGMLAGRAAAEH